MLHALARHVAGDGRVVRFARDFVNFVNVNNAALGTLNFVVAALQQLEHDVFHVLTHVAGFGQGGGVGHHKGDVEHACQGLGQQGFAGTGGADQQDIAFGQLHVVFFGFFLVAQAFVVVVHRHRQGALGRLLADNVVIQVGLDFGRRGQVATAFAVAGDRRNFVPDDFVAQVNAFVADEHRRTGNEFFNFVLALATERAIQVLFARSAFFFGHGTNAFLGMKTNDNQLKTVSPAWKDTVAVQGPWPQT